MVPEVLVVPKVCLVPGGNPPVGLRGEGIGAEVGQANVDWDTWDSSNNRYSLVLDKQKVLGSSKSDRSTTTKVAFETHRSALEVENSSCQ